MPFVPHASPAVIADRNSNSAYEKLKFIEEHYEQLMAAYQDIMAHLRLVKDGTIIDNTVTNNNYTYPVLNPKFRINTQVDNYTTQSEDFDGNTIIRMDKDGNSTITLTAPPDEEFIGSSITIRKTNGDQNTLLYLLPDTGVTINPLDVSPIRRNGGTVSLLYIGEGTYDAFGELP